LKPALTVLLFTITGQLDRIERVGIAGVLDILDKQQPAVLPGA
jgi:hypothetical protein